MDWLRQGGGEAESALENGRTLGSKGFCKGWLDLSGLTLSRVVAKPHAYSGIYLFYCIYMYTLKLHTVSCVSSPCRCLPSRQIPSANSLIYIK
jgi:hypothetical protein